MVARMSLPYPDPRDEDLSRWQARRDVEHWQGIHDRPGCAAELVVEAGKAYLRRDVAYAAARLHEARYAFGAEQYQERIDKGLALCQAHQTAEALAPAGGD